MPPRPSQLHIANRLRHLSLTSQPATALFYSRLYYSLCPPFDGDHDSLHIHALCLLQAEQPYSALHLVRDTADPDADSDMDESLRRAGCYGCALVVAKCCSKLARYSEGQAVLERAMKRGVTTTVTIPSPASTSASAHLLLAVLSHKGKASAQAVESYTKALQDDPWIWEAFTGLCDIGSPPSVELLFPDPVVPKSTTGRSSRHPTLSPNPMPRSSASEVPGFLPRRQLSPLMNASNTVPGGFFTPDLNGNAGPRLGMMGNPNGWDTPSGDNTFATIDEHPQIPPPSRRPFPNLISAFLPSYGASASNVTPTIRSTPVQAYEQAPAKPPAMKRSRAGAGLKKSSVEPASNGVSYRGGRERDLKSIEPNGERGEPAVRRSSRLSTTTATKPSTRVTREKRHTRSRSATSSASGQTVDMPSPVNQDAQYQTAADDWLRDIVRRCARAYRALSMYECQEAMNQVDGLPREIQHSAWALDIVARAYYEMANYVLSRRAFTALLDLEPYRLESMEHYSTLLWHLGDAPALSYLSQTLMSINREAPQPWIAAGNCFSLQKDHDEAMRCFKRATQVDPGFAYAWTLCGYEAIEMEEFERAIAFFRTAIRTESRHYNAWYGMGLVYLKTGKAKYAEHHFRRAAEINPTNAVLLCCIGMVLEQMDDPVMALRFYDQAIKYAPESPMVKFKRIRMLVGMQRLQEAMTELVALSKQAPDEANIFFLLGKCHLKNGYKIGATIAFTTARELQPKLEGAIKSCMEANGEESVDEGE